MDNFPPVKKSHRFPPAGHTVCKCSGKAAISMQQHIPGGQTFYPPCPPAVIGYGSAAGGKEGDLSLIHI